MYISGGRAVGGDGPSDLNGPRGLCIDSQSNLLFVADREVNDLYIYICICIYK
jgi:hypothetical protein